MALAFCERLVELWDNGGVLDYECSCPQGDEGNVCKHCVAVGLTWLTGKKIEGKSGGASGKKKTTKKHDPWLDIRAYLSSQRPESLVDLLLDVAQRDDRLLLCVIPGMSITLVLLVFALRRMYQTQISRAGSSWSTIDAVQRGSCASLSRDTRCKGGINRTLFQFAGAADVTLRCRAFGGASAVALAA